MLAQVDPNERCFLDKRCASVKLSGNFRLAITSIIATFHDSQGRSKNRRWTPKQFDFSGRFERSLTFGRPQRRIIMMVAPPGQAESCCRKTRRELGQQVLLSQRPRQISKTRSESLVEPDTLQKAVCFKGKEQRGPIHGSCQVWKQTWKGFRAWALAFCFCLFPARYLPALEALRASRPNDSKRDSSDHASGSLGN